jgi:autotransporter-associated beta strand protein
MKSRFNLFFGTLAVIGMTQAAQAASDTWKTVATNSTWHDTNNWIGGSIPNAAADIVTFNSGSNFTTVSIGSTPTTVDQINFSGASVGAFTLTGTGTTNMVMSTNGGGVFIDSTVTANQDLSGIPIIRPGMGDTINFSNQGSGFLKLGTFQAQNSSEGSLSTLVFKPGASGNIEIVSGKTIANAGTGGVKKIAIVLDDVGTLKMAVTTLGSWDGSDADGNSVTIRQGTYQAASIKNSGTNSSLGLAGRIQFGKAATTNTATLDYYGASDTTNRAFYIIDNNTAVFKVSGSASTNLSITSSITQSGSAAGGAKLTKDGVGILTLGASNSHSNQTLISAGRLVVGHANALGTSGSFNSRTTINTAGTLELATDTSVATEFLDITSGNSGAVVVNRATAGVGITQSTGTTYLGSGSAMNVTKGSNVTSGTATLGIASVILAGGSNATATLNSDTAAISVTGLVSSGVVFNKTLALTGSHAESAISGIISNGSSTVALTKSGTGTWTLTNANTYDGATNISGGKLDINGDQSSANGTVTVSGANTRLAGDGTIGGSTTIESSAIHSPGNSPGVQKFTGDLTYADASIFEWDIDRAATQTRGTGYDGVNVTGTLAGMDGLDGGTTTDAVFRIVIGDSDFSNGFWDTTRVWTDIFTAADGTTARTDWAGIFGGGFEYFYNNGTTLASASPTGQGSFSFTGVNNNQLTWTAVPEPTTALAGILLTFGLLRRRRA